MSDAEAVAVQLAAIPGWENRPAKIIPMPGGFHHQCFRIDSGGYRYVLRVPRNAVSPEREKFALECRLQQQAASRGLAAPILHVEPRQGLMLTEYLPGRAWTSDDLDKRANLQELATLLRRLHTLPRCDVLFDAAAAADLYRAELPDGLAESQTAKTCLQVMESTPPPDTLCLCHNDVVAENVIEGDSLKLVDFEYACDNDPLFDLAGIVGWHHLPNAASSWLLAAYAGSTTPELQERLGLQLRHFDALQWLWLAAQQSQRPVSDVRRRMVRVAARLA